jgi:hypothetical protein
MTRLVCRCDGHRHVGFDGGAVERGRKCPLHRCDG